MKRLAEILVLCAAVTLLMGADIPDARFKKLGGKIMCTCGTCTYMLLECNHVGCPNSELMIRQLRALTGASRSAGNRPGFSQGNVTPVNLSLENNDEAVLQWFRDNWGVTAVVEPSKHGLELWAWIMPPSVLILSLVLVFVVVRKWRLRPAMAGSADIGLDPNLEALRDRARRETEV